MKGFELSYDDEVPEDADQGQSRHESPEHGSNGPDIPILQPAQPPAVLQLPPFDLYQCIRCLGGIQQPCLKHWEILIPIYLLDQLLCTANALEEAKGYKRNILHIVHILHIYIDFMHTVMCHSWFMVS